MATKEVTKTITVVLKGVNKGDLEKKKKNKDLELSRKMIQSGFDFVLRGSERVFNNYVDLQEDYLAQNGFNIVKSGIQNIQTVHNTFNMAKQVTKNLNLTGAKKSFVMYGSIALSAAKIYAQNQARLSGIYQQLNATNMQTGLDASRAGLINGGRGTEN